MLVCLLAAAGEGLGFDPACAGCYVAVCGVPVDTFPGFLSTDGMFPGLTFGLPIDVVVENLWMFRLLSTS